MKKIHLFLFSTLFFLFGIVTNGFSQTATYTVTKTTDPDPKLYNFTDSLCAPEMYGTFQWAIRKSNDDGVSSNIVFNISGSGVHTIYLTYEPPTIIWGDLTVDGTSQPGYQGTPLIVIDGQNKIERGLYFHDYSNYTVKGLGIRNCTRRGILFEYATNILAENNVITQIRNNDPDHTATAIRIVGNPKLGYTNATIRNNYLGTDANLDTTLGCDDAGILVGPDANSNLIFGNTIAYNHQAGVYVNSAQQNKISQNLIFGQNTAIALIENANGNKAAPDSLEYNYCSHILSGIAEPFDSVEIFGGSNPENIIQYITTTQADTTGYWSIFDTTNTFNYYFVTATKNMNTSVITMKGEEDYHVYYCGITTCLYQVASASISFSPSLIASGYNIIWVDQVSNDIIYEYNLSNPPYSNPNLPLNGLSPGLHTICVYWGQVNSNNLIQCDDFLMVTPLTFTPTVAVSDNNICLGETVNLVATPTGYNYFWDPEAGYGLNWIYGNPVQFTPQSTGTLSITCSTSNACNTVETTVTINIRQPEINYTATDINCSASCDGQINVSTTNGYPPYSYQWNPANVSGTNLSNLCAGTYQVTVTDAQGCTDDVSIPIDVLNESPTINTVYASQGVCENNCNGTISVSASNGTSPYYFGWSNSATTQTINNLCAGDYSVTVTDANGCTAENNYDIESLPVPNVAITGNVYFCSNDYTTLDAGAGFSTYLWNTGATSQTINVSSSGTYSVTVTNNNNCSNSDDFTVEEKPLPYANITVSDETCMGASDGQITGTVYNATPPYTVTLSTNSGAYIMSTSTNSSFVFNNIAPGYYIVTIGDNFGCSQQYNIHILPSTQHAPTADFFQFNPCNYLGSLSSFYNNSSSNATSFIWDLGEGFTTNTTNAHYTFQNEGYHCITLTASNACGSDTHSEIIFVNPTDCPCNQVYDYHDGDLLTFPPPPGTYTVEGDLIVPSGTNLSLTNVTFQFAPKGRLIIEQGAILNANLSTFTALCPNTMWQGIEVWGYTNENSYASLNPPVNNPNQGFLDLDKSNVIEYAHIGILVGRRDINFICNQNSFSQEYVYGSSGGIIKASGNTFHNNGIDIKFIRKNNTDGYMNSVTGNEFLSDNSLPDIHYQTTDPNAYPNPYNPWAGDINIKTYNMNPTGKTCFGVDIKQVSNFSLVNNDYDNLIAGVRIIDGKINIYSTSSNVPHFFNNMNTGIAISNSNSSLLPHEIYGYEFTNISGYGIVIAGSRYDYIHDNFFGRTYISNFPQVNTGIYSVSSSNYRIVENTFNKCTTGIFALSNKTGFIGASTPHWDGNKFNACQTGILTVADNHALTLRCNQHIPDPVHYDANWKNLPFWMFPAQLANQGHPLSQCNDTRCPAGNRFNYLPNKEIISNNDDYYYYHHNHTGHPELVPVDPNGIIHIMENSNEYWQGQTVSCLPVLVPAPSPTGVIMPPLSFSASPYNQLDSLEAEKTALRHKKDSIVANLDHGETQLLLDALASNMPRMWLTSMLLTHSPLSDTVLIAAITREKQFPPMLFTLIMMKNLPVSSAAYPYYRLKYQSLPYHFKRVLSYIEANPVTETPTLVENTIKGTGQLKANLTDRLTAYLLDSLNNRREDAIALLEHDGSVESLKTLVAVYVEDSNYTAAAAKLALIPQDNTENTEFVALYSRLLNLYEQGKTIYEMDSTDLVFIDNLARECPENLAVVNARGIIELLTGEHIQPCPLDFENRNMQLPAAENIGNTDYEGVNDEMLGDNYPDPAQTETVIPYNLPEGVTASIVIRNELGSIVARFDNLTGENELTIKTTKWNPGTYLYSLVIENIIFGTKKMIIVK